MQPLPLRKNGSIQLTYDLPHRVSSAQVYPILSPNGSSIIICGLDSGLRILWRGGRPFRIPRERKGQNSNVNGGGMSEVMVIDSDDDEPNTTSNSESIAPEFENHFAEVDSDAPYENIMRVVDIPMAGIRALSTPNVPKNIQQVAPGAYPTMLRDQIVVATACVDHSVVIVSLPLIPPAPSVNDLGQIGVQLIKLAGPQCHQDLPASISMTYTYEERDATSRSRSRTRQNEEEDSNDKDWSFLVASTSSTAGGLLLVHELRIADHKLDSDSAVPIQRQYLRSGIGCKVLFNPSAPPTARHSNLLVTFPSGTVKVYQCVVDRDIRRPRSRRGSSGTMDSLTSTGASPAADGKFIITLYTTYLQDSNSSIPQRAKILDVAWISNGTAILALLEDGSWGTWDLEGTLQSLSGIKSQSLLQQSSAAPGTINGRQLVQLSMKGKITIPNEPDRQDVESTDKSTRLAPMTPHTRKIRSDGLFKHRSRPSSDLSGVNTGCFTGSISVSQQPSRNSSEESILIFYGKQNIFIPNLSSFFKSQAHDKSMEMTPLAQPTAIPSPLLPPGASQTSIHLLPPSALDSSTEKPALAFSTSPTTPDILTTSTNHLIFLCKPIKEPELDLEDIQDDDEEDTLQEIPRQEANDDDQLLLTQGALDIDGMSRILDGMQNGGGFGTPTRSRLHGRSIGPTGGRGTRILT